jgi:PKD repeat protein
MATYYVEATGSNTYPFDSREKAAISFYDMFEALSNESIYELTPGDLVYVNGLITEPDDWWGWYSVYGASIIGTDPSVDIIDINTATFDGGDTGASFSNLGMFTTNEGAEGNSFLYGVNNVDHCKFDGGGIAGNAIVLYGILNTNFLCNTFFNFMGNAVEIYNSGVYGSMLPLNQGDRSWSCMDHAYSGDILTAVSYGDIYKQYGAAGDFIALSQTARDWKGIAGAPNDDVYAVAETHISTFTGSIYKQTGGINNFVEILASNPSPTAFPAVVWGDITVAPNGDIYACNSIMYGGVDFNNGIWKSPTGGGAFSSYESSVGFVTVKAAPNGDIYAIGRLNLTDPNGARYLYRQDNGQTGFSIVSSFASSTGKICIDLFGNIYVLVGSDAYISTNRGVDFELVGLDYRSWRALTVDLNNYLYGCVTVGDIYKRGPYEGDYTSIRVVGNSFKSTIEDAFIGIVVSLSRTAIEKLHFYNNAISSIWEDPYSNNVINHEFVYESDGEEIAHDVTETTEDPLFLGVDPDPLAIDDTSPCYHAGRSFILGIITEDILGALYADPPSIGAYEVVSSLTADFSGTPLTGAADLSVQFTDLSVGTILTWDWDFGDGSAGSTEQNPLHEYGQAGTYTVVLSVANTLSSDSETKIDYVTVSFVTDFSGSPTVGNSNLSVTFTDLTQGSPDTWLWDFGDGSAASTEQNPVHTYTKAGLYPVTLISSNSLNTDFETKLDYITVGMLANFTAGSTEGPAALIVNFTDLSLGEPTSWDWDFGDGSPHSTEQNPIYTYTLPGYYTVVLMASRGSSSDSETKTDYIHVINLIITDFVATPRAGYIDTPIQFTDLSEGIITTWEWDFGDGSPHSTEQNPTHRYYSQGLYTVTLVVSDGVITRSITKDYYITISLEEFGTGFVREQGPTLIFD